MPSLKAPWLLLRSDITTQTAVYSLSLWRGRVTHASYVRQRVIFRGALLSSFGETTATGLSELLEGTLSHDQITRFLSQQRFDSKTLWQLVKPMVRAIEDDAGVLIFDDTIQEKPYTDENELISWHFDHSKNRTVKGINLLNCVYHAQGTTLPVAYELITKPIVYRDEKTDRLKRKSACSKNELKFCNLA